MGELPVHAVAGVFPQPIILFVPWSIGCTYMGNNKDDSPSQKASIEKTIFKPWKALLSYKYILMSQAVENKVLKIDKYINSFCQFF